MTSEERERERDRKTLGRTELLAHHDISFQTWKWWAVQSPILFSLLSSGSLMKTGKEQVKLIQKAME